MRTSFDALAFKTLKPVEAQCLRNLGALVVLREGSGITVDGTAGEGLTISTCIKDAGNLHLQKRCRARFIINVRRAMSSGSGQRPGRVFSLDGIHLAETVLSVLSEGFAPTVACFGCLTVAWACVVIGMRRS